jgi:hypothetical protein
MKEHAEAEALEASKNATASRVQALMRGVRDRRSLIIHIVMF